MSSSSRSSGPPWPLSLPLCKLSYCTTPTLASKMTWTHIPAQDDMFAVVDQVRRQGLGGSITTRKTLKLIRGGNLLVRSSDVLHCVICSNHVVKASSCTGILTCSQYLITIFYSRMKLIFMILCFKPAWTRNELQLSRYMIRSPG